MKYRKKTIVVEANVWDGSLSKATDLIDWMASEGASAWYKPVDERIAIETLEGTHHAAPGDYLIRGIKGEFYPCKPDIFEATYEAVV